MKELWYILELKDNNNNNKMTTIKEIKYDAKHLKHLMRGKPLLMMNNDEHNHPFTANIGTLRMSGASAIFLNGPILEALTDQYHRIYTEQERPIHNILGVNYGRKCTFDRASFIPGCTRVYEFESDDVGSDILTLIRKDDEDVRLELE